MAKNFVQVGENLTLPVKSDVKSGELVQVGDVIGIALTDAKTDNGTDYYTTIATKGVWNLTLKATTKAGGVVSAAPKGVSKAVPVGFALEDATYSDTDIVVPVLLCLGLAYGAANSAV
jgi:predicted RecA/RadA family phage recombinase